MFIAPSRRGFAAWFAAVLCLASAGAGFSQAPEPTSPPAAEATVAEDETPVVLDEITVTAQKREENIQLVPLSITTHSEKFNLLTGGGGDVKALSGRVPSLLLETSFGRAFPRFYVRGLGNTDFDLNASQPVSMMVDDVVLENPVVKGMPLWDLERTRSCADPRAPSSAATLPPASSSSTPSPVEERDGFVQRLLRNLRRRSTCRRRTAAADRDPLDARLGPLPVAVRLDRQRLHRRERRARRLRHRRLPRAVPLAGRPTASAPCSTSTAGTLDGTARVFRANILKPGSNDLASDFSQDKVYQDGLNDQEISAQGGAFTLNYEFDFGTLTAITGYETLDMFSRGDIDGGFGAVFAPPSGPGFIPFPSESADGLPELDQFTQEIRLASDTGGALDWLVGFFYFDESLQAETASATTRWRGNVQDGYAFQDQDAESWALFTSLDFRPTDRTGR